MTLPLYAQKGVNNMRRSMPHDERMSVWQSLQLVLLGVLCVVVCFFIGSYWLGPWLFRWRESRQVVSPEPTSPGVQVAPASPPVSPAVTDSPSPRMEGVRIRERRPETLPDVVRVIPARSEVPPASEEPEEPTTIEEQQPPAPSNNLWSPPPTAPESGDFSTSIQQPQPLDSNPVAAPSTGEPPSGTLYRVRVSSTFNQREEADAQLRSVKEKGLPGAVVADTVNGQKVFRVQLGVYRNKTSAENLAEQARRSGIVVEVTPSNP